MAKKTFHLLLGFVVAAFVFSVEITGSLYGRETKDDESFQDISDVSIADLLDIGVITASKKEEKVSDAPGIVSVITPKEIRAFGGVTLMDLLQRVPGLQPISSHLFVQNVASIRGDLLTHSDNHVLVLLNGRPMREGVNGGINSPIYTSFPVEMIDRIEVVRGPGSVLYGTNAYVGIINIITKPASKYNKLRVSGLGGSLGSFMGTLSAGLTKGDLQFNVNAQYFKESSWNFNAQTPRPGYPTKTIDMKYGEDKIGIGAQLTYKGFGLLGFYSRGSDDVLGMLPYASYQSKNNLRRLFLNISYQTKILSSWDMSVNVTHNLSDSRLNEKNEKIAPNLHYGSDWLGEVTFNGSITRNVNLVFGGVMDSRHKYEVPENSPIKQTYHLYNWSAYAQMDYSPFSTFKLIAGAQLNKPYKGNSAIVPRLGAIFNFKNGFGIKALYAEAFRSPSPLEQMMEKPILHGNPALEPETILTTDLQVFYSGKKIDWALTYFRSSYKNLIQRIPYSGGGQIFSNEGEMKVEGVEFEIKANLAHGIYISGSAAYQDNKNDKTLTPHTMIKFGAAYQAPFGLNIGIFNSYFGKPFKNQGQILNPEA